MSGEDLPSEIRQFISQYVRSVEQLEILLLVAAKPCPPWSLQAVYDVVLSSKPSIERWLEEFIRLGFVQKAGEENSSYQFAAEEEVRALVEKLDALYKVKPVRIIEAIFKREQEPAQSFADAFKLRKKP